MNNLLQPIGTVYIPWAGEGGHTLCLDLSEFVFLVDTEREFVPLHRYLDEHPERRQEVARVIQERLG